MTRREFLRGVGAATAALTCPPPRLSALAEPLAGTRLARFAHLTDLHFTNRRQSRYPTSHRHIRHAVASLNGLELDFVLFSGDMFHFPEDVEDELEALVDALRGLTAPYYCLLGNHDVEGSGLRARKRHLMRHLGDRGLADGSPWYALSPAAGLRLVALDTTDVEGDAYHGWGGLLGSRQQRWLGEMLARPGEEVMLLAMHHPPVTPYPFLDRLRFDPRQATWLGGALQASRHQPLVLAGHFHFGARSALGGSPVMIGPSLVEHPHPFRVFEVFQAPGAGPLVRHEWHTLGLHGPEDEACSSGPAGLRSFGLMALSDGAGGALRL